MRGGGITRGLEKTSGRVEELGATEQAPDRGTRLAPGTVLNGRYRIEAVAGRGAMGVVYRVTDELRPGRQLALKTIGRVAGDGERLGRFKAEFRHMTQLRHPNVAEVYDFEPIQSTDDHLFTMEYVDGRDIRAATEGSDWRAVVDLLVHVCRALSYVHSRKLVHFDLKPANVMVDGDGRLKVLDFGIAEMKTEQWAGGMRGTPYYMAPELAAGETTVNHQVDLYSLGIMAYELLCRRLPFTGTTLYQLVYQHHFEPLVFDEDARSRIPGWLREVVERLCAKAPSDRYRTANAVIEAINARGGLSYEVETPQTRESYLFSSRFVGRDGVARKIHSAVLERIEGTARPPPACLVCGPSGVGKSRLMREIRHRIQLAGIPFFQANCYEGSLAEHGPIVAVIRQAVRLAEALDRHDLVERAGPEIVKLDPELGRARGIEPSEPLEDVSRERLRLMEQVRELLVSVAREAPYVVYVNDLQWAQQGTIDVLSSLLRRIGVADELGEPAPLALLGTYRDDEVAGRPLEELIESLPPSVDGDGPVHSIGPLGPAEVGDLIRSMLGVDALPDAFVDRVARETHGNPYFVEEVMRVLVDTGTVFLRDGKWAATEEVGDLDIPRSIATVFLRRASMLEPTDRAVLDLLAVSGRPTPADVLSRAAGLDPDAVHEALLRLRKRHMVALDSRESAYFRIAHDRMRGTLYDTIADSERRRMHGDLAAAIEERSTRSALPDEASVLAHHYSRTGSWAKAVEHGRRAAQQATAQSRFADALALLEQAEGWLSELPAGEARDADLVDVLLQQERLQEILRRPDRQQGLIDRVLALLDRADPSSRLAEVWVRQGELHVVHRRFDAARSALEHALALARGRSDLRDQRSAHKGLAFMCWTEDHHEEAASHAERTVEIDRELGELDALAVDLGNLGVLLRGTGKHDRALAHLEEALEINERIQRPMGLLTVMYYVGNIHRDLGELDRAMEYQRRAYEIAVTHHLGVNQVILLGSMASIHLQEGRPEDALRLYHRQVELARQLDYGDELAQAQFTLGGLLVALDRQDEATPHLRESLAAYERLGDGPNAMRVARRLATILEAQPDGAVRADELWRSVRELARRAGDRAADLEARRALVRTARSLSLPAAEVIERAEDALAVARELGDARAAGDLLNTLGILEVGAGHHEAALDWFRQGLDVFEELGDRVHAGLMRNSVGVALRRLGRPGEARRVLTDALADHRATGQRMLEGHAQAALGDVHRDLGRLDDAIASFEASLALRRALGDARGEAWMLSDLASAHHERGEAAEAERRLRAASEAAAGQDDGDLREALARLRARILAPSSDEG